MDDLARYSCQLKLPVWGGAEGQARLRAATVAVVGTGATGCAIADTLVRAGVGTLRLIDRDVLEASNLQRQVLYDEQDLQSGLPKAELARRRLAQVNAEVALEAHVTDLHAGNVRALLDGADLVLDGTDNFLTRFVINDACAQAQVPWVYAGVVGTEVHGFPVLPGEACFRCYIPSPPEPGSTETCQTGGVLGSAVLVAAGLAATEGLKLLVRGAAEAARGLLVLDVWTRDARRVRIPKDPDCPTCAGRYDFLAAPREAHAELCGQDAVALRSPTAARLDLEALAARLTELGALEARNRFLLRFTPRDAPGLTLTVFADGRALVRGTQDPGVARSTYAKYVGT
ncbi:MAG: ThiF family adenylyltransferase [Planctomycetota bacterium]